MTSKKTNQQLKSQNGFTLIELLVVISIIGLLASILLIALVQVRAKGRDARRKADMTQVQKALELYYSSNGSYPSTSGAWWGTSVNGGSHGTSGSSGYIPNLAPTYVDKLPVDPLGYTSGWSGYNYRSYDGNDYKLIISVIGPESFPNSTQPFYDPCRPGTAWMVTNNFDETANILTCGSW